MSSGLFALGREQPRETGGCQARCLWVWLVGLCRVDRPLPLPGHRSRPCGSGSLSRACYRPWVPGSDLLEAQASGGQASQACAFSLSLVHLRPPLSLEFGICGQFPGSSQQVGRAGHCPHTLPCVVQAIFFHQSFRLKKSKVPLSDIGRKLKIHISCRLSLWICPKLIVWSAFL